MKYFSKKKTRLILTGFLLMIFALSWNFTTARTIVKMKANYTYVNLEIRKENEFVVDGKSASLNNLDKKLSEIITGDKKITAR